MTGAPQVLTTLVGQEDVGATVALLRPTLQAPPVPRQHRHIHVVRDPNQEIDVLRIGLGVTIEPTRLI
jgi:hypothetical protein